MKKDIKKTIIDATIKLIEEKSSNPADITIRDICKKANIGVSLINYHFQTKDNLIAQCVQVIIGDVIEHFDDYVRGLPKMSPMDTLKTTLNNTCNFLFCAENISRISILTNHQTPKAGDNTTQTINKYLPLVEKVWQKQHMKGNPKEGTTQIILFVQGAFLRTDIIKEELAINLRNEAERKKFLDDFLDNFFQEKNKGDN